MTAHSDKDKDRASKPSVHLIEDGLSDGLSDGLIDADSNAAAKPRKGIYLLPNLITSAALFAGFYAMVASMNGHYIAAGMAVMVALFLDTADGRIARYTGTESEFGAQFDSLSDMAAFGVAPALLVFSYSLSDLGRLGWIATFIYMACAALRLARFNTESDLKSFTGLASPAAAVILASLVWVLVETYPEARNDLVVRYAIAAVTVTVGLLMVSPIRYFSPKAIDFNRRVQFLTLVAVVVVFAIIVAEPPRVLLVLFSVYALSGPLASGVRLARGTKSKKADSLKTTTDTPDTKS